MTLEAKDVSMATAIADRDLERLLRDAADRAKTVQVKQSQAEQKIHDINREKLELQQTVAAGEERLAELRAKHELLKGVLSDRIEENDTLTSDNGRLQVQKQCAQDETHVLAQQVESMRAAVETANASAASMRDQRDDLQQRLSAMQDHSNIINKLQTENIALESASESKHKKLTDLQNRWQKLDGENKDILLEKCNLTATIEAKDKELANLRQNRVKELENLQQSNGSLKITVGLRDKALAEVKSTSQSQQDSLQQVLDTKIKDVDEARLRHNIILTKLGDARAKLNSAESAQQALEDDLKVLRATVKAYQSKEDGHQTQLNTVEKKKQELAQALTKAKADIDVCKRQLDEAREDHKTNTASLREQKDVALQEVHEARELQKGAEERFATIARKLKSTESENVSLRTSRDIFRDEWEQKVRKQADMKLEVDTLLSKLSHAQRENSRLSEQMRNVQKAIGGCTGENQALSPISSAGENECNHSDAKATTITDVNETSFPTRKAALVKAVVMSEDKEDSSTCSDYIRRRHRDERDFPAFVRLEELGEDRENLLKVLEGPAHPPDFGAGLRNRFPHDHKGGIATHKLSACEWKLSDVDLSGVDGKVRRHSLKYQLRQPVRDVTPIVRTGPPAQQTDDGDPTSPATTISSSSTHVKTSDRVIDVKHQLPANAAPERKESISEARRDSRREIDSTSKQESEAEPAALWSCKLQSQAALGRRRQ